MGDKQAQSGHGKHREQSVGDQVGESLPRDTARGGVRHGLLLRDNRIQRELGLSAEKRVTLIDFFEALDEENGRFVGMLYPPSGPGGMTKAETMKKTAEHAMFHGKQHKRMQAVTAGCLTTSQFNRLLELERRCLALFAFEQPDVVAELKLTPDQVRAVKAAVGEYREKYDAEYEQGRKPSGREPHELARPYLTALEKALTEAQRKRWAELLGAEPKIAPIGSGISRGILVIAAQPQH